MLLVATGILLLQLAHSGRSLNASLAASPSPRPNYLETGRQITRILDKFMSLGYDKRVRPNYGGPPVEVNVTMRILSISSVSEVMMDFTADFYFRQTWHDPRLSFEKLGDIQTLYVGAEVSKKIWLPDTFFGNEKLAYFHEATTPNVFLRIDHSGEVYRSIRLTVTSSCPMNLQYFPMDRQRCTIEAESYGYNVKDIIYRWARKDTAVERDEGISLPQFDIVKTVQKYRLEELSSGTYSRLIAEIHFARRMGYYLIQIYIPSSLIVVISWVSFWLHRNASPARVQLGVTTVLTMTTLMSSTNAALPKISYVKSIDIFLGTCFIMVFAALLEYATVGYLGKRIAMRKAQVQHAYSQAQARTFAQLQSQGAQGDPVPPLVVAGSPPLFGGDPAARDSQQVAAAAAAAAAMQAQQSTNSPTIFGNSTCGAEADALDAIQQAALIQQIAAGLSRHACYAYQQTEEAVAPSPPPRSCKCALSCHESAARGAARRSLCPGGHLDEQHTCGRANQVARQPAHCTCAHQRAHICHCGARQTTCAHDEYEAKIDECTCARHRSTSVAATQTLPRNITFVNQQKEKQLPADCLGSADICLSYGRGAPFGSDTRAAGHPFVAPSKTSPAAQAAAATFVNMHRRNKGLPPSTNPNLSQFAWSTRATNRNIETIFGVRPSDIDKYSRVIFPVCFVCFQLMYWIVYLHISAFLDSEQQNQQPPS